MQKNSKNTKKKNFLSLIIPVFKQEKTIIKDLKQILEVVRTINCKNEIIVVIDGFLDKTKEKIEKSKLKVKCVGYKHNHGKGYAVRYGMSFAKGNIIAFIDSGMDLEPTSLIDLLEVLENNNADIVVGSKLHPLSKVSYPLPRVVMSIGYRSLVKLLFGLSVRDTQVGLKIYRRKVLEKVMPRLIVKRYAFDIEILAVSYYLGFKRIYEAPITLKFNSWSSVTTKNFWKVIGYMLWDTMAIYYRLKLLHYYDDDNKRKWLYDKELNFRVNIP